MKSSHFSRKISKQNGFGALFITLVLLLISSLVVFYTFQGSVTEQRLSASEIRTKQAFAAANAGFDHALAHAQNGGIDQNGNNAVDTIAASTIYSGEQPSYYRVAFCKNPDDPDNYVECELNNGNTSPKDIECDEPDLMAYAAIVSCGWSDDLSSVIRITSIAEGTPALPGKITAPVVTRGTTNLLTGGASILNYFNDLTVWSGGGIPSQSNTGKTFIRDTRPDANANGEPDYRDTGNSPACNNPPAGYVCSTQGTTIGHDTVINDTTLSSLTATQFFERHLGKPPAVYRDTVATWVVDLNNSLATSNSTSIDSIDGKRDATIWVEGDASLSGTIGTEDHPVVLVINGDLSLGAGVVINGLVFVTGHMSGNGTPTIYGALVADSAAANGNLKVIYDPNVLGKAYKTGKAASLQGSWKDW